ncbi:hypothetical protein BAZMOX_82608_0 [methanotrophic endosymbiont of Bathymodiolus azoricus (Menez Gwen)]|nr:hypothetical protein BAZMOX_82608_0 [methanotrophic endosymbiont of Bathymodiolus azoricus (Menez Gwen)]
MVTKLLSTPIAEKKSSHEIREFTYSHGPVAMIGESEERPVFRHNYPAKAINCL